MQPKYLVAIDFETANSNPHSVCQVGLLVFEEGELIFEYATYLKPPLEYNEFNYYNIQVHGITEHMVKNAPTWKQVYGNFKQYFDDAMFVSHNASFDMNVLKNINQYYNISLRPSPYYCTVELSRKVYTYLPNHKLNTVSEYLEIDLKHHDAHSDAYASAMIVFKTLQNVDEKLVSSLFEKTNMKKKILSI